MPNIKLPDGKSLNFKDKVTGFQIAEKISKSLSKQALIISVDGSLKDLNYEINKDCSVKIYTSKAYREVLEKWEKPFLIANSDNDPVTGNNPRLVKLLKRIPSAQEVVIKGPGHFLQEEAGPEYSQLIIDFINGNPQGFTVEKKVIDKESIL